MSTSTERKEATPVSAAELMGLSKWELVQIVHWALSPLEPAEQRSAMAAILQQVSAASKTTDTLRPAAGQSRNSTTSPLQPRRGFSF
jgi:hypothetical protein